MAVNLTVSWRLPGALAGRRVADVDPALVAPKGNPAAVGTDAGPVHGQARINLAWGGGIRMENPAARIRFHAVAVEHGLGDHPAVLARGDRVSSFVERQALWRADDQATGVSRVEPHRPAEEAVVAIGEQVADS